MRHAIVTGLAGCADAKVLVKDKSLCNLLALARQRSPKVAEFLTKFPDEAERAIHDDAGIPEALPALTTRHSRRGLNACLRLGIAEPLIQAALKPSALQSEALDLLLVFTHPPRLDRIDGHAHENAPRDAKAFAALVQSRLDSLLDLTDGQLKAKAVELLMQLQLRVEPAVLQGIVADAKARSSLRAGALKMLASTGDFGASLDLALDKKSPAELRREALKQLFAHQPDRAIAAAATALNEADTTTKQLALSLLASSKDDTVITEWLDLLAQNKAPAAIQLDILEAAATRESLKPKLASLQTNNTELLEGGDVTRGRDLVTNHLGANCIACHTVEAKEGSQVGPNLKTIGSTKDRPYLLESLLNPLAVVAPGYGLVSITLKNGKSLSGALDKEDATQIILRSPDGKTQKVPRDQIATSTPPISVMPPMLGILTKAEIRDVVAYLASLKAKKK
jgi:putative heme-binding domain-containing protein